MQTTKGMRIHIGIFGKRNVGKSSIINALTGQDISIVSDTAGTTTDIVEKSMELLPLGPVVFIDTAGIDDVGELGVQRIEKTYKVLDRIDIALIVFDENRIDKFEQKLIDEFNQRKTPFILVENKIDTHSASTKIDTNAKDIIQISAKENLNIEKLKQSIIKNVPENYFENIKIVSDLISEEETAVLVVPCDFEAPKGRLILPQVQTIRDLLDNTSTAIITKTETLEKTLNNLKNPPAIVITDSQAFAEVSKIVPKEIKLTSFSILFARLKGDLKEMVKGATAISKLKTGDKVLICESCTHQNIGDDIARVKIPKLIKKKTNADIEFEHYAGHDFPANIKEYKMIIHCGACMTNRKEILSRILKAKEANVPISNYGLTIAYSLNIFERALEVFPDILEEYKKLTK
ncbi:MAG: [FeFe] hydrogenase H-cluster maturation GTPase HydF [bacterium]|nr:[FeFe] hydrogenase H-cluster maturation GTPase HydF [bacterium]